VIGLVAVDGTPFDAYVQAPRSGFGPGMLVLGGAGGLDASTRAWCDRYAEEGYAVIAPDLARHFRGGSLGSDERRAATADAYVAKSRLGPYLEAGAKTGALGIAGGAAIAWRAALHGAVDAAAIYGHAEIGDELRDAARLACPFALHLTGSEAAGAAADVLERACAAQPRLRIHTYPKNVTGFAEPDDPHFDRHAADLAHSRSLGIFRPVLGPFYDFARLFHEHVTHEFVDHDPDATMATMVDAPYVNHVPTLTGGVGHDLLKRFYTYHFIPKVPRERESVVLSETVGPDTVVIEHVSIYDHTEEMDYFLPGIPPTGKRLMVPTVVIAKFKGDKLYHEHIYWDQASVLVQLGLLDPAGLPVAGADEARKMLDQTRPANELMEKWKTSEGKPI
jgi:carboxymethylenebutenolidase